MERKLAENLVLELARRRDIVVPNRRFFTDILADTEVSESSRFYEALPNNQRTIQESGRYHCLSLRRVLRNRNAKSHQLSQVERGYEALVSGLGIYSSDVLSRSLRADEDLVEMMSECEEQFSLLGKFQTYDYENPDKVTVLTKPVLIIPGFVGVEEIHKWERDNTRYGRDVEFLLKHLRGISP